MNRKIREFVFNLLFFLIFHLFNFRQYLFLKFYKPKINIFIYKISKISTMYNIQENAYEEITTKVQTFVPQVTAMAENVNKISGIIGSTGSGKSALISYLKDAPITFNKMKGARYAIQNGDPTGNKYPKIGHQMKSCTSVPAIFQANGQSFVDLTGWFDTGSSNQEIINGFTNSTMFKKGKQVKIVIVAEISSIIALRGGILVQIVDRLSQFFQEDLIMMLDSILLVLSKVNTDDWDIQTVVQQIKNISDLNQNLTRCTKTLIQTLIRNKKIVLFPHPDKITNHIDIIKNQIKNTKPTVLTHDGKVTLSHQALNSVHSYISILNGNIFQMSKKIALQIRSKFMNFNFKNGQEVNIELNKLRKAESIIKNQFRKAAAANDEIKRLQDLKSNLGISINCSEELTKNFTMVAFYRKLNGKINVQSAFIQTITLQLTEHIGKLDTIREKMTSQEERKLMEIKHNQDMKKRDLQNKQMIRKSQEKMAALARQNQDKIIAQHKQFFLKILKSDAKYAQSLTKMNEQLKQQAAIAKQNQKKIITQQKQYFQKMRENDAKIITQQKQYSESLVKINQQLMTTIANSKPQTIIYEDDSGGCQIM